MSEPTSLYSNLVPKGQVPISGTTASGLSVGDLVKIRNGIWGSILPDGPIKNALMNFSGALWDLPDLFRSIINGRRYSTGEYVLGERLFDQIQCQGNIVPDDVPDELIPISRLVFTMLFGVRINNDIDLTRLEQGVDAYYNNNPNRMDQPRAAVERAVFLKKTFFPSSTYNNACWNMAIFDQYPLVAPVPEMRNDDDNQNRGRYYTGPGFNGQQFVNGMLAAGPSTGLTSAIDSEPGTGTATTTSTGNLFDKFISFVKTDPLKAAAVGAALWFVWNEVQENN